MSEIANDEHVTVCGITGSGKSHWLANYAAGRNKVLKLDTKGEAIINLREGKNPWAQVDPKKLVVITDFKGLQDHNFNRKPYAIYVPTFDELDDASFFEEFFKWNFFARQDPRDPFVTWVDEIKDVIPNPHSIPRYMKATYTKGRFLNHALWGATQEPRHIHSLCLSQPTHIVAFDLPRVEDRKRLADNTGCPEFVDMPTGYNFWYFRRGWRSAVKGIITD